MKTKSIILFLSVLAITLTSCGDKEVSINPIPTTAIAIETGVNVEVKEKPFVNPALIEGSNFGAFFISILRASQYDMALKFTSKASIEKFGAGKIKEKYQNFKFNYNLKLASKSEDNNVITLKFTTSEFATGKFKEMKVVIENDSCKLVLPDNLDDFLK